MDYLEDLGIDAIWLMPINPSPSYHKYDVTDYRGIHRNYGTMNDFKAFIQEAHKRDIRVIMDFVINHSGADHPWFLNAKSGKRAQYRDYYVWADKDSIAEQIAKKETSFDSDNITQWHPVDGDTLSEHYYGFFWGGMPDLNYDNPEVRKEFYEAGKFWLREVGVDGFRLDAAKHIYPDDRAEDSHAFWKEFKAEMETVNPYVYLIGEVWSDAKNASPYAAGFTGLFNFDRAYTILESVNNEKVIAANISGHGLESNTSVSIADVINASLPWFKNYNPNYIEASFLSNHDQNRVASVLGNDPEKIRLAASLLFTLPGTPYIYYGEEIGMLGMKPDENIREPMIWDDQASDDMRAAWMNPPPVYTTDETVASVAAQKDDEKSLLNLYKELIALKQTDVFALGDIQNVDFGSSVISFSRSYKNESVVVVHNLASSALTLDMPEQFASYENVVFKRGEYSKNGIQINIGPKGSVALSK